MADIKWLPDGEKAFEKVIAAVPEGMRAAFKPKLLEMLAGKAGGKKVSEALVKSWVKDDLPEPQRSVLMAALGMTGAPPEKAAPVKKAAWKVTGTVARAADLAAIKKTGQELLAGRLRITVSSATCGLARGSEAVFAALQAELKKQKLQADLVQVGSCGMAYAEPVVEVVRPGKPRICYGSVAPDRAADIVKAAAGDGLVPDLALLRRDDLASEATGEKLPYKKGAVPAALAKVPAAAKVPFFQNQRKIVSANAGTISPERIEEYIGMGGYSALARALTGMKPADVIKEVKTAKLRGRGGAGFPAGIKWEACRNAAGDVKYIVCNGSEGDPEIGMHRSFLESDPHMLIEGMLLAGYAVGAAQGYVYLNDRYLLAIERVETAISQARQMRLLGTNIMGSGFSFDLQVKRGGGAYVCGEETALLNALEGSFGEPRPRPPLPVEKGLFGKPTVVNNLETLSNVPAIVLQGGTWYAGIGTPGSKGTKIVALSGSVARPCWVEVEMGTKVDDIITEFGGGTASGKKVKAFQTGGPSGGVLPASQLKIKLDYDALAKAGSLLGSGGLLVLDEDADMVGMAKFLTDFFADESCGKCTPCREGVKQLQEVIGSLVEGRGTKEQLQLIQRMGEAMSDVCFCALGKTAAAPMLTVMKHFPSEINRRMLKKIT
jgi:NADH:ubiquinone oxidoreductase subunit F (NADH-binding)